MKNGPFADVFPVENGDILSLCQFTRGYVVLNTLRANLAGIFSVLLITRAKLAGISLLQTQVAVSQTWLFFTPPPQKKKTLGKISPKWEEKETWLQIQHLLHSCWQQNCFFLVIYTCWICFRKKELPIFQPTCENKLLWMFIHFTPKTSHPVA